MDEFGDIFQEVTTKFTSIQEFADFALADSGLALSRNDVYPIIEDDMSSNQDKKRNILKLWRNKKGDAEPEDLRDILRQYLADGNFNPHEPSPKNSESALMRLEPSDLTAPSSTQQVVDVQKYSISGGDFKGASLGPQTYNLTRNDAVQNIFNVQHITNVTHVSIREDPFCSEAAAGPDGQVGQQNDKLKLSDSITMLCNKRLGCQGNVYEGELTSAVFGSKSIALKFLPHNDRNMAEAQILHKVQHPNVVSIIGTDVYNSGPMKYIYIAMERCHTQNLYGYIKHNENYRFDLALSVSQVKQLVTGITHIHEFNIIHRDLKPDNVLFSPDGRTVKVADFGLSKELDTGRSATAQTTLRLGTDGYRAPETYGGAVISQKADIFSLGVVTHFILSGGEHPYGEERELWNYNIKENKGRSFEKLLPGANDDEWVKLLDHTLQFEPSQRPSAKEILKNACFTLQRLYPSEGQMESQNSVNTDLTEMIFDKGIFELTKNRNQDEMKYIIAGSKVAEIDGCVSVSSNSAKLSKLQSLYLASRLSAVQLYLIIEESVTMKRIEGAKIQLNMALPEVIISILPPKKQDWPHIAVFTGSSMLECKKAQGMMKGAIDMSWWDIAGLACQGENGCLFKHTFPESNLKVSVILGDITRQCVDAIVNSTGGYLMADTHGVAAAIFKAGGKEFRHNCSKYLAKRRNVDLSHGDIVHTKAAGDLACKNVVHVCGPEASLIPEIRGNNVRNTLENLCQRILNYANDTLKAESVALPAISTGYKGVQLEMFCQVLAKSIKVFATEPEEKGKRRVLKDIRVVNMFLGEAGSIAHHMKSLLSARMKYRFPNAY